MDIFITTILKRPYVLAFLISYIFIALRVTNLRFTLTYLVCGYTLAFMSEFISIHFGFPYGWYFYKYENLQGEWLNNGVPVWDSVSYVFMCFAGLYAARFTINKPGGAYCNTPLPEKIKLILLSAFFVTLLDVVIDPAAHMGKRWFLGDIYYYPFPGPYFDVTLANFAGWFLVSALINGVGVFFLGFNDDCKINKINSFLSLGLYYGIMAFGLVIALYLRSYLLVLCDLFWIGLTVVIFLFSKRRIQKIN